jgi:hypothetical protein
MRFVSIKKRSTVTAKKAKKAVKTNPKKKGLTMSTHKKKKKVSHKKRSNPSVKVKKVSHKKRKNPYSFKKKSHKRRHNPMGLPKMGGLAQAAKEIVFTTLGLIVVLKVLAKIPISQNIKNFAKIGAGLALMVMVKNPIAKFIGLTVAVIGGKDALAEKWPETFAGEDEYLIAGEDDFIDGEDDEYLINGTNSLVNGAELMGTNNLLRGDYQSNYDQSNSSDMPY